MNIMGKKIMTFETRIKITKVLTLLLVVIMGVMMVGSVVNAAGETFGESAYTWVGDQIFYLALIVVAAIAVPFIAKKMWMQLVGFIVLASLVLVIIKDPTKVKAIGETIWTKILG